MPREIFKITSAGSVDDGKSTILARLLLDTGSIYEDQIDKDYDPNNIADLLDGLESERDQGITIDVAHRFFDSELRRYQIADSPGHEQYTRNMATACAGSDCLMLVIDVREGIKPQTQLHLEIALRLGIREVIFAVNKIDLVGFSKKAFTLVEKQIETMLAEKSARFSNLRHQVIPVSGLTGANVVKGSSSLKWFNGPTLIQAMDQVKASREKSESGFIAIEYVQRRFGGGRRYLGSLRNSKLLQNDKVFFGGEAIGIKALLVEGEKIPEAKPGAAVSLELTKEIDLQPGNSLTLYKIEPHSQIEADLIWLSDTPGVRGRRFSLKSYGSSTDATITKITSIDPKTDAKAGQVSAIQSNQIVRCNLVLQSKSLLPNFEDDQQLGKFILIDPFDGQTVAAGTVNHPLRRGENLTRQEFAVAGSKFSELTGQTGRVIWLTGLSGSGKSTLANAVSLRLFEQGKPHYVLDGDNLRLGINNDLGFTDEDRSENVRRTAEIAKLMADAGLIVLVCLVSPFNSDRKMARDIIGDEKFNLVFMGTSLEICEQRDPKGLYKKARRGEIPNMTGLGSPFENPDIDHLSLTPNEDLETMVQKVLS